MSSFRRFFGLLTPMTGGEPQLLDGKGQPARFKHLISREKPVQPKSKPHEPAR